MSAAAWPILNPFRHTMGATTPPITTRLPGPTRSRTLFRGALQRRDDAAHGRPHPRISLSCRSRVRVPSLRLTLRTPNGQRCIAVISRSHRLRGQSPRSGGDPLVHRRGRPSCSVVGPGSRPRVWGRLRWNRYEQRGRNRWQTFGPLEARKQLELARNRCAQLPPAAVWIAW
jgi:hypothetical protein